MMTSRTIQKKVVSTQSDGLKICSINICGLSKKSELMVDKYADTNNISVLLVQETGLNSDQKSITNFTNHKDSNDQKNKGCSLFIRNGISFSPLPHIAKLSKQIDSVWGILVHEGRRFIIGTIYWKLDYLKGIKNIMEILKTGNW